MELKFAPLYLWYPVLLPKTMDLYIVREFILYGCFTLHWKVLRSGNLRRSVPLEMLIDMLSFFAEVKTVRFWPKTMDYNQAFLPKLSSFFEALLLLAGRCYEAEICVILFPLRCSLICYPFLPKSKFSDFGRKPWTIIRRFYQN